MTASPKAQGEITTVWNRNFICVMLANLCLCLSHSSVNPLVASYTQHLGTSVQVMGLLTGMFFGVSLAMRPVAGPATTKLDKRKLLILVFSLGCTANLGYALFHSVPMFVAFRFINGVQYSLVGSLIMTLAGDNLPPHKIASGMGLYGVGGAIGTAAAPSIGIALLDLGTKLRDEGFGFTLVFLFAALILGLAIIPSVILHPDKKSKADIASTGAWYKNIFTVHAVPIAIVMLLLMSANSLYNTYMVEYAKELNITGINSFYLVLACTLAVTRPLSGYITDKFGVGKIMFPAMALYAVSFFIIGSAGSLTVILIGAVVAALGMGASQPTLQAMCIQSVTPLKRGVATNTLYIGIDLALFGGPFLGSVVYDLDNYATMFKSASVPVVLGMVVFALILPIYYRRRKVLEAENS